jgi:hypothetical protein
MLTPGNVRKVEEATRTGFKNGVILRSGPVLAASKDLLFGPAPFMKPVLVT